MTSEAPDLGALTAAHDAAVEAILPLLTESSRLDPNQPLDSSTEESIVAQVARTALAAALPHMSLQRDFAAEEAAAVAVRAATLRDVAEEQKVLFQNMLTDLVRRANTLAPLPVEDNGE